MGVPGQQPVRSNAVLAVIVVAGFLVSLALGLFSSLHPPTAETVTQLWFPTPLHMKAGLSTAAMLLGLVQLVTAARMFQRFGTGPAPRLVVLAHRISGSTAVLLTLPVAFHCAWSLGFGSYSNRVLVHSIAGCTLYGVFVAKMLSLHTGRIPRWVLPTLGICLLAVLTVTWLSSALWWFTNGSPSY